MTEIYIFRHGETTAIKEGRLYSGDEVFNASVLPEFIPSLKKMANFLKDISSSLHFSSTFPRCRQTVEIVSRVTGKKFEFDGRLDEAMPEETLIDVVSRISKFIKDLEKYNNQTIMICSHGAIIATLAHLLINKTINEEDFGRFPFKDSVFPIPQPGIVWRITDKLEEVFKI